MDERSLAAVPTSRASRTQFRIPAAVFPILGLAAIVVAWWLITVFRWLHPAVLPPPQDVVRAFRTNHDFVLKGLLWTGLETLVGFLLSAAAGFVIGLALASSTLLDRSFSPLLVAVNAVPKIAVAPLLVAWLGFGQPPIQFMIFVMCFFPIVLSTVTGLTHTPAELAEMARSLNASRWRIFTKVRLPSAQPHIFVGLKLALPLASVGAIIGEFQAGDAAHVGLGSIILQTMGQGDSATAYGALVLIAATTVALFYVLVGIERMLLPWVRATTER